MKKYDLIMIGTGSAMNLLEPYLQKNPNASVAVIDKDDPGGICLNKGCIPTKMLVYPAECVRELDHFRSLGIETDVRKIHFNSIMQRMRLHVFNEMNGIRESLRSTDLIDYYEAEARFTAPYTLSVGGETVTGGKIFLCTGSKPQIPEIEGIESTAFYTSDTVLDIPSAPESMIILGGGYIAAEYGHFFSAMGTDVTVLGRNPRFLKEEDREISETALEECSKYMKILTGCEAVRIGENGDEKIVTYRKGPSGTEYTIRAAAVLAAAGRTSNSDILHPEAGGIETDEEGWITVNEYLETSQPNVWAFGDATGKYLFKHVANYESELIYYNVISDDTEKTALDYHAVPHAVFTYPEIAAAGMTEDQAVKAYDDKNVLIGIWPYGQTGKGLAMGYENEKYFVKVLLKNKTGEILGAHILGPQASVLLQEITTLMYTRDGRFPMNALHIHPGLSEVVQRAFSNLYLLHHYRQQDE